jgi:nitroreductase / dihydropteridine reductase
MHTITTAVEAMNWRYAIKRMNNQIVPDQIVGTIIEAIHLSPSSLGLQPYKVFIITDPETKAKILPIAYNQKQIVESSHLFVFAVWDKYTDERIEKVLGYILSNKGLSAEDLESQITSAKNYFREKSDEFHFAHAVKQSAVALGVAILTAALEGIDASSMEGFNPVALDELLGLTEKGLKSTTLFAIGYRDEENDWNYNLKKARKPLEDLVTNISKNSLNKTTL